MSETEKPFTVSDRRHFTPEGRPREESEGDRAPAPDPEPVAPVGEAGRPPAGPPDFSQFLIGLAAQAGILLSDEAAEKGKDHAEALEGARSIIGILDMLKDKTEGRRTPAEDALLEDLLFQVRMAYVGRTRGGGS
jgi:hypothetical protein